MEHSLSEKTLTYIAVTSLVIVLTIIFSASEYRSHIERSVHATVDSIVVVNKNFRDSSRTISSYEAALKYKIIPDQSLKNPFIKKHVHFFFSENSMDTLIDKNSYQVCKQVINGLGKLYKDNDPTAILVNGVPLKEMIKYQSNIDGACSHNDSVSIKNILM